MPIVRDTGGKIIYFSSGQGLSSSSFASAIYEMKLFLKNMPSEAQ